MTPEEAKHSFEKLDEIGIRNIYIDAYTGELRINGEMYEDIIVVDIPRLLEADSPRTSRLMNDHMLKAGAKWRSFPRIKIEFIPGVLI